MESDIVKRKIKIYIIGLQKNDPEIMMNSPVKYLKNNKCDQINRLFSTTFIYSYVYSSLHDLFLFSAVLNLRYLF